MIARIFPHRIALAVLLLSSARPLMAADSNDTAPHTTAVALPASAGSTEKPWVYGETTPTEPIEWINERPDEAAQGIQVQWSHLRGLRIQVRHSNDTPGQVLASLRLDITNEQAKLHRPAGVNELIERGLVPGGLMQSTAAEVAAHFAGTGVRFLGVQVSDDALTYTAECRSDELPLALQLLRAEFGDPGWRADAEAGVKQAWLQSLAVQQRDVAAQVDRRIATVLSGPYPWRRPATSAEVKKLTFHDADTWLGTALQNATLTVTLVGDTPPDAAQTATLWFGPYRVSTHFMVGSIRDVRNSLPAALPFKPGVEHLTVDSSQAKAVVHIIWPTDDAFDSVRTQQLTLLAQCLNARLQSAAQAKFGSAAEARVWSVTGDTLRGDGQIHARLVVRPDQADAALALARSEAAALAHQGITAEQVRLQKATLLKTTAADKTHDTWWLNTALPYAGWQPFRIYWAGHTEQDIQAITPTDINTAAKRYLVNVKSFAVVGIGRSR